MKLGAQAVLKTKGVLEAAVCYTGNFIFEFYFQLKMFFVLFMKQKEFRNIMILIIISMLPTKWLMN